jgi:serine/threonine protein kinase
VHSSVRDKFLQEAYALAALGQHSHIVRYYGSWEDKTINAIYIQCEWCKGGSLKKQPSSTWTQNTLCNVLRQISMALSYMHSKGFTHGDVKPENILVDSTEVEENSIYKICDLGQINDSGDGKYLAPEVLHYEDEELKMNPQIMSRADIFSLGISIFELAHEHATNKPFSLKQRSQITQEDIVLPEQVFDCEFVLLLRQMMHRDPAKRPTADQIIRHPLLRDDLEWRLEQEICKVAELQKRFEELERELLKTRKQRYGPSYPKRVNKFDMSDLKLNLVNGKVLLSRTSTPSVMSPFPTHSKEHTKKDDVTPSQIYHSQRPNVLSDITNFGFSPCVTLPIPTGNVQTTVSPTPVFSPGLSFNFSPPPSNP